MLSETTVLRVAWKLASVCQTAHALVRPGSPTLLSGPLCLQECSPRSTALWVDPKDAGLTSLLRKRFARSIYPKRHMVRRAPARRMGNKGPARLPKHDFATNRDAIPRESERRTDVRAPNVRKGSGPRLSIKYCPVHVGVDQ